MTEKTEDCVLRQWEETEWTVLVGEREGSESPARAKSVLLEGPEPQAAPLAEAGDGPSSAEAGDGPPSAEAGDEPPSAEAGDGPPSAEAGDEPPSAEAGDEPPSAEAGDGPSSAEAGDEPPSAPEGQGEDASPEDRTERDHRVGHRRRLFLSALLAAVAVMGCVSLGAMAQQAYPAAAAERTAPPPGQAASAAPPAADDALAVTAPLTPPFDFTQPAPEGEAVEDDWFSDAVFLGDSRTDGLRLYSGIRGADFLAYKSLMIFQITGNDRVERKAIPLNGAGEKKTALEWLEEKTYGKVYLMFGINELGYGDDSAFAAAFAQCVEEVRARQPEAVIYIQSLVPIEPEKAHATNPAAWLNNDNVARYNQLLRQVCGEEGAIYVDVADALTDDAGILPPEGTTDGIHFTRSWYEKWYAYLKTHTVDAAAYAAGLEAKELSQP